MEEKTEKKSKSSKIIVIIIAIVIIVAIVFAIIFFTDFKRTKLTEDNFEEVSDQIEEKLDEDELAYFTYSVMYHMFNDGLSDLNDENAAYKNIYGKTIKELIDEGKDLMEEHDVTVDEFKESMSEVDNTTN